MTLLVEAKNKNGSVAKTFNNVTKVILWFDEVVISHMVDGTCRETHLFTKDFDVVVTKRFES